MKKYKQFIIGVIVGAILFSFSPITATVDEFVCRRANYKVMVNGDEYISSDLPILNYNGNTYAPFRSILEKAGLNVVWNAELSQAEVTSNPTSEQNKVGEDSTMKIELNPVTGLPVGIEYVEREKNGKTFKLASYNDILYISSVDLKQVYEVEQGNLDIKSGIRTLYKGNDSVEINLRSNDYFNANNRSYYKLSLLKAIIGE